MRNDLGLAVMDFREFLNILGYMVAKEADDNITEQVSIGNDSFRIVADGKVASRTTMYNARKIVKVNYLAATFELALQVFESELRAAIAKTTKVKTGALRGTIKMMYRGKIISSTTEITDFGYDDYLLIFTDVPYAYRVNDEVKSKEGIGFMLRAARRIRSLTRSTSKRATWQVGVIFSRALGSFVKADTIHTRSGTIIQTPMPAIRIKLRRSQLGNIQGG